MQAGRNPSATDHGTDPVSSRLAAAGVLARPLRHVLALLASGWHSLDDLIRIPAVPRRTVEELLAAAGPDIESHQGTYRLTPEACEAYRERFALDTVPMTPDVTAGMTELTARVREFVERGPRPRTDLDHVTATPETALRRALWLRETYDLAGARLLCLGDHDLTSLATCLVEPSLAVTVVDVDERILAHIDHVAAEQGFNIRTLFCDLRAGLPSAAHESADLVFTDPPYTSEGIALFAARAVECLRDVDAGRVLVAYGYSDRSPALGRKVQQELLRLGLVFEAILPGFHRYQGAQAIGSASDLYVCQPTAHTRKIAQHETAGIYTHGPQSVESQEAELADDALTRISEVLKAPVHRLHAASWAHPIIVPANETRVFDLHADPGPWLLRMLLACDADRAAFLLPNNHPDIGSEHAQRSIMDIVGSRWSLRFHRNTPDSRSALVVATTRGGRTTAQRLLRRAHGKIGNIWREALISTAAEGGSALTKRAARDVIEAAAPYPDDLSLRLIDLPRHRIAALLDTARTTTPETVPS